MLYPLKFKPILKERVWGGYRIPSLYGIKTTGNKTPIGESWLLSGVEGNLSEVANGFLAGNNIEELIEVYMGDLIGEMVYQKFGIEIPILIKLIDTAEFLSIQVHPNDEMAKRLHHTYGKSEMWYILESDENSKIINGFTKEISQEEYMQALREGELNKLLKYENVKSDNFFHIPAGRVHSIGDGILLAEIQQTSDVTYRIFDWNRKDKEGKLRELHTDLALEAIDFKQNQKTSQNLPFQPNHVQELIRTPHFVTSRIILEDEIERDLAHIDSFVAYLCLTGKIELKQEGNLSEIVNSGELILVPAEANDITLTPFSPSKLLEVFFE